jgi:hypothetical protein
VQIDPELYPWLSAAALVWGVLDCFLGYRVFKITIAVLGGVTGIVLGHFAATAAGLPGGGAVAAMIVGGLLGAGLAFLLYLAAVFFAGFGFGATLGLLLLARLEPAVAVLGAVLLGLVMAFVAVKLQRVLIVLSTALLGSFRAVVAGSAFTSQTDWLYYYRQPAQIPALLEGNPWMFPSILVLAAIGVIAQLELGGAGRDRKPRKD